MSGEPLWYWLALPAAMLLGFFFLYLLSRFVSTGRGTSEYERLEGEIATAQMIRRRERTAILHQYRAMPRCPDGSPSPLAWKLWEQYKALEAENERLSDQESRRLSRVRR